MAWIVRKVCVKGEGMIEFIYNGFIFLGGHVMLSCVMI